MHQQIVERFRLLLIAISLLYSSPASSHLVGDKALLDANKKMCEHAYMCFHDTIIICGQSQKELRTFLDLCDMYEFACEHNTIYRHVKEEEGICPNAQDLK